MDQSTQRMAEPFLPITKSTIQKYGPEVSVFLFYLIDKHNYFKLTEQLEKDEFFYVLYENMQDELNLSKHKLRNCKKKLIEEGIIDVKKRRLNGGFPIEFIHLNLTNILALISHSNIEQEGHPLVKKLNDNITINKKEQITKKKEKKKNYPIQDFLQKLPEVYQQDLLFRKILTQYVSVRKSKKKPWTDRSQNVALGKFEKYFGELTEEKLPLVRQTFEVSVENEWYGVFPERLTRYLPKSKPRPTRKIKPPIEVITEHFDGSKFAKSFFRYYEAAEELLAEDSVLQKDKLTQRILALYDTIEREQGGNKDLPSAGRILSEFTEWLNKQDWLEDIRPEHFTYGGKVFSLFQQHMTREEGRHPITGKRYFTTHD